jgi:hypothetical protein
LALMVGGVITGDSRAAAYARPQRHANAGVAGSVGAHHGRREKLRQKGRKWLLTSDMYRFPLSPPRSIACADWCSAGTGLPVAP